MIIYPVFSGVLLFLLNAVFVSQNAYTQVQTLDIAMHFLGGCIVAWFLCLYFKNERKIIPKLAGALLIIGGTALVGILWEFFEWSLDNFVFIETQFMGGLNDTLFDLAMDLAGGLVVALFFRKQKRV